MNDLISRQAAIDLLDNQIEQCDKALGSFDISREDEYAVKVERASLTAYKKQLEYLPSEQPEQDEWCTDCKEYDAEKHCCPRFNRVIRNALKDAQPEIIRCGECRYYRECEIFGKKITLCKRREYDSMYIEPDDFCSRAERKEQDDG